jgi:opacity protein-like surface antigen
VIRFGYTPYDRLLFYATGGVAHGPATGASNLQLNSGVQFDGLIFEPRTGWTTGARVEYAPRPLALLRQSPPWTTNPG